MKVTCWWLCLLVAVIAASAADTKKAAPNKAGEENDTDEEKVEAVIEDVNAKQLERLLEEKDYVAVFWCKKQIGKTNQTGERKIRAEMTPSASMLHLLEKLFCCFQSL